MASTAPPPFLVQERPPPSSLELGSRDKICFLHPGYSKPLNLLLTLPRVDCRMVADTTPTFGVHHRTALLACQIIAGNAFHNSFFALDCEGRRPIEENLDDTLTGNEYYFIVNGNILYPIVPSFQDWEFPHGCIPDSWPQVTPSSATTCGITNCNFAIEGARLVPQKERAWYDDNQMLIYGFELPDIDNQANILPLRKDLHHCFDNRWFVIVPKIVKVNNGSVAPSIRYVTHIISQNATELWPTYHNTLVESLQCGSRAYLFARFAWAILLRVKLFVIRGYPRQVIQVYKDVEGRVTYKAENCTGKVLSNKYGGGGSQAANSKKRRSERDGSMNDEENPLESSGEDSDSDSSIHEMDGRWDLMDDWNERGKSGRRGRKERQMSSEETAPDIKVNVVSEVEMAVRETLQ